jgi:hypothetical protein
MVIHMQCSTHAVQHTCNAVQRIDLGVAVQHVYVAAVVVAAVAVYAVVVAAASAAAAALAGPHCHVAVPTVDGAYLRAWSRWSICRRWRRDANYKSTVHPAQMYQFPHSMDHIGVRASDGPHVTD